MPSNSLGFMSEVTGRGRVVPVDVETAPTTTMTEPKICGLRREAALCFAFTTSLVLAAVGVGVWFAVTEL